MQQLENAIFQLIIELMGGEANLRRGMSATRHTLHNSFDKARNATINGVSNMPERFKQSMADREKRSGANITMSDNVPNNKLQEFLRTSEPGMSEQERNYICKQSRQITDVINQATKECKPDDLTNVSVQAFKTEIKKYRELYSLSNTYKKGGDKALTEACNFDKKKKECFYQSLPNGKQIYERINQAKLEGRDTSNIEKEVKELIDKTLSSHNQTPSFSQSQEQARDNTEETNYGFPKR